MKRVAAILALGVLFTSSGLAEIRWTYHPSTFGPDGRIAAYATSMLGSGELRYVPPAKWTVSGTRIIPPGKIDADAFVEAVPIQAPTPWTPDRAKAVHAQVVSQMLPKGSTDVAVLTEGLMPVQICGQAAYEISLSYVYYGRAYSESVVFVEHDKTQLQFHFGCLKEDFPALHGSFAASLLSMDGF